MKVKVNLLPESYRRARRRHVRYRAGVAVGVVVIAVELGFGVALYVRTARTRELLADAKRAQEAAEAVENTLAGPQQEAAQLAAQVRLASELRRSHRWSRLFGVLAKALPENVVLSSLATEPPRWTRGRAMPVRSETAVQGEKPVETQVQPVIEGLAISGYAVEHGHLAEFVAALQASGAFSAIDVSSAKRDKYLSQEAILFELRCRW